MPSVSPVPMHLPEGALTPEELTSAAESATTLLEDDAREDGAEDDDVEFSLDLDEPPEDVLEYAHRHLGETPEKRDAAVAELRDMVYERGDVAPHRLDDAYLLRYLRARTFQVEKAYRLLCRYYSFKDEHPQMHMNVNLDNLHCVGDDNIIHVLPYRENTGRRILIYKMGNWNPSKYGMEELFKASLAVLELAILEPRAQVLGGVCIFDLGGLSLQHAWHVTPAVADRVLQLMGGSIPIRTHAIHIVNQSWIFDTIFAIFKPLLDERMRGKIHFHGSDMESLHRHVEPKFLPEAYGGTRPEWNYMHWMDALRGDERVMRELRSLGYRTRDDPPLEVEEDSYYDDE
ncbi:hypothetical protein R5R35_010162 [Gryllus longicercus]|uniref:CRAL-TRIO domain-containing protein n=1 Tax=Gryllus longicercus TaxID=2509291 RepID=A0AAN9YXR8_9ORTH